MENVNVIGFYKSNKDDYPLHTTEKFLYFVVFENGYEDGSKTWLEGYNVIDGHFELKDKEYLTSCERITKEEYLRETEGLYTPVEYLQEVITMTKQMTDKQKELLYKLGDVLNDIGEQCELDDNFHEIMIDNNDIIPMSLDELACEWYAIAQGKERRRIDGK